MSEPSKRAWLRPILEPLKPIFREVLAISFFVNILALAVPVFVLQVYDRVVNTGGISTLQGLGIGMVLVLAFDYILRTTRSRIMQTVALRVDVLIGREVFNKVMSLPLHILESKTAAHWQSLFRDVDVVRNTLSGATAMLVADLPFAVLFLGLILIIAAPIAPVLLVMIPVFMFVAWRSASVMGAANREERGTSMNRDALVAEIINGRTTIKALALDQAMRPMFEDAHADNITNAIDRGSKTDTYSNLGATLTLVTSISLTCVGAVAIINQELTMGALIATNMLSGRLLGPLNQLVSQWRAYSSFRQTVERLGELFNSESDRLESEVKLDRPKGEFALENVYFSYTEGGAPVIDNLSFTVEAGGVHAIVGRNGCGKSTALKLLQGLYKPSDGRVIMDGADMAQFTRSELASWIGYVPQECVLFAGSVRQNVAHRHPDASDEEVVEAATAAGVHKFIIDLPDGYASEIGEAGRKLSGGQRQRIAIARALVGNPPALLLDEPSSSLDRQAEQELRNTLIELGKERTVVMVTHTPALLAAADHLVVLDRGKVALAGPAKEILPRLLGGAKAAQGGDAEEKPPEQPGADAAAAKPPEKAPAATEKPVEKPTEPVAEPPTPMAAPAVERKTPEKPAEPQAPPAAETPTPEKPAEPLPAPMGGMILPEKLAKTAEPVTAEPEPAAKGGEEPPGKPVDAVAAVAAVVEPEPVPMADEEPVEKPAEPEPAAVVASAKAGTRRKSAAAAKPKAATEPKRATRRRGGGATASTSTPVATAAPRAGTGPDAEAAVDGTAKAKSKAETKKAPRKRTAGAASPKSRRAANAKTRAGTGGAKAPVKAGTEPKKALRKRSDAVSASKSKSRPGRSAGPQVVAGTDIKAPRKRAAVAPPPKPRPGISVRPRVVAGTDTVAPTGVAAKTKSRTARVAKVTPRSTPDGGAPSRGGAKVVELKLADPSRNETARPTRAQGSAATAPAAPPYHDVDEDSGTLPEHEA